MGMVIDDLARLTADVARWRSGRWRDAGVVPPLGKS
jgi:hypothetical protein